MPLTDNDIENAVEVIASQCTFVDSWIDLPSRNIKKVFGKRVAEAEAFENHCQEVNSNGWNHSFSYAQDELALEGSHIWRPANRCLSMLITEDMASIRF